MRLFLGLPLSVILLTSGCGSNPSPSKTPHPTTVKEAKGTATQQSSAETNAVVVPKAADGKDSGRIAALETTAVESPTQSAPELLASKRVSDGSSPKPVRPQILPVDLTRYYQVSAETLGQSTKYPWKDVPLGTQTLGNVPLEIGGHLTLWGAVNAQRGANYVEAVKGIELDRKFESLYLYHATFFPSDDGTPILNVVLHYDDGTSTEHEICYGTDVRDWYASRTGSNEATEPRSKRVWHGPHSSDKRQPPQELQFFLTELTNPLPSRQVKTLDLVSLKSQSAPCIMAMTTGASDQIKLDTEAATTDKADVPATSK